MAKKYTFVTGASVWGDDKQTVEILSREDVRKAADGAVGEARGDWEREKNRMGERIEQAVRAAAGAAETAGQARKTAEETAERLAADAKGAFRDIVAESLEPLLASGLQQVLANQQDIRDDHERLAGLAADAGAKAAAAEARAAGLEEENGRLRSELSALRGEAEAARKGADEMAAAWVAMRADWSGIRETVRAVRAESRRWSFVCAGMAVLSAALCLCGLRGCRQGENPPPVSVQAGTEGGPEEGVAVPGELDRPGVGE